MNLPHLIFLFFLLVYLPPMDTKATTFKYLRAVPCGGRYSPGGVYSEYLRSMRMKKDVESTEDGLVKGKHCIGVMTHASQMNFGFLISLDLRPLYESNHT